MTARARSEAASDLVTGATGMLGSHIAERLVARGRRVRALVRPASDATFLDGLGVAVVRGNLTDLESCRLAARDVDVVYHAAAKVGDWGPWRQFQTDCIDATRTLARAAAEARVGRFLHISSTSAYGHPPDGTGPIDETTSLGREFWVWDHYTRSKVESERILWNAADTCGLRLTVIRPSWLYGERDRTTTVRLVSRLRMGKVPIIGRGDNPMSAVYAGTVADAAILAAADAGSVGNAYNVTHQGKITQTEFLNLFAAAAGAPPVVRHVPYRATFAVALFLEAKGRLFRQTRPPLITRYATWLMGRYLDYSTAKAEKRLGWSPAPSYQESMARTMEWYRSRHGAVEVASSRKE
jgi:nucleoside-diphosphate-sugar epimerase